MEDGVYVGNAGKDAALDRGWLLGHFKEQGGPRHSDAVEVKGAFTHVENGGRSG